MSVSSLCLLAAGLFPAAPPQGQVPGGDRSTLEAVTEDQARSVERGLLWLADRQESNGSWIADVGFKLNEDYSITGRQRGHLGVTSLAGMAFLAGGHLPGRGRYGTQSLQLALSELAGVDWKGRK